jgi:hypothetical protein
MIAAVVVSHQISPFALALQLGVLALAGRLHGRWLPVITLLASLLWLVTGAHEFFATQWQTLTGQLGSVSGSVNSGFTGRLHGDTGQLVGKVLRIGISVVLGLLATAGAVRLRRDRSDGYLVALAGIPLALLALQSYGGEIFMRVFLFALPFLSILSARLFLDRPSSAARGPGLRRSVAGAMTGLLAGLAAALVVARGGNDAYALVTPGEVATVRSSLDRMPGGSSVMALLTQGPLYTARIGQVVELSADVACPDAAMPIDCVLSRSPDAVIVTASMQAYGVESLGFAHGWADSEVARLVASGRYRISVDAHSVVLLTRPGLVLTDSGR